MKTHWTESKINFHPRYIARSPATGREMTVAPGAMLRRLEERGWIIANAAPLLACHTCAVYDIYREESSTVTARVAFPVNGTAENSCGYFGNEHFMAEDRQPKTEMRDNGFIARLVFIGYRA